MIEYYECTKCKKECRVYIRNHYKLNSISINDLKIELNDLYSDDIRSKCCDADIMLVMQLTEFEVRDAMSRGLRR